MFLLEFLYLISAAWLAVYGLNCLLHTWWFWRKVHPSETANGAWAADSPALPRVTVQLPIYNEKYVVARLLEAVVNLDWPADRLQVQVLDDSTDITSHIVAQILASFEDRGIQLNHVRRPDRRGFKAGALQYGLQSATGQYLAIFDADFLPPRDFLRRTIPQFETQSSEWPVGCVQARWGHVNRETSFLTRAQALGIDGHFVVEQAARNVSGAFMNFNGTAGVWRRDCMVEAGGWEGDTLTEDLDLSYRAQMQNWRIAYQPEIVVPAELPVLIDGFKRQQFRWAKGSIQTAIKLAGRLWRARQPLWRKVLGTLHLTNYAIHPLMVLNLLLTLPMTWSRSPMMRLVPLMMLSAIGPPLMYWTAMSDQRIPWIRRWPRLLALVALGMGLSLNNTRAVVEAVFGVKSEFERTPKFAITANEKGKGTRFLASAYRLPGDKMVWVETLLAIYASLLLVWGVLQQSWWLIGWILLYVIGYWYIAGLAFIQARQAGDNRAGAVLIAPGVGD